MVQKPSIPKGTRDFSPIEMERRNYIFNSITDIYKIFGYKQIETPAMENLSTLMGKYGEEGDKLLFKILNSGDFLSKVDNKDLFEIDSKKITTHISEKGLRYDLTVPFARYVVQHQNDITFPFKRFQIQAVWRADRPQRGRYREFFQCDSDVIGSKSLLNELELIQIMDKVFSKLKINVIIKINNRKILAGLAEAMGHADKVVDITIALDKVDKIGIDKVIEEIESKGINGNAINILKKVIMLSQNENSEKLLLLKEIVKDSPDGNKGIAEMEEIFELLEYVKINNKLQIDLTLARGLNYYTGAIFEVIAKDVNMGSICGGGRYDDLTGIFGLNDMSGVGVSFGADRIYDVLTELDGFPKETSAGTKLMLVNFGDVEAKKSLQIIDNLRLAGISAELYPETAKLKKQMIYANQNKIEYVLLAGQNEFEKGIFSLKNMESGEQKNLTIKEIIEFLK
ncbi:MAG: histidine--tRNA ligase [Bacteroidetes bacterium CG2_30_33_31]|nr:MAG: histidine--tRNA ligase [Bacteroidetes bacterium CG2_30_33_31]